ncbi:MAG: MerR family DNA-binding protein [Bacteroidota bacterium]|nr:MerR family DNA-binding protein [Bacteroidota bacterium]
MKQMMIGALAKRSGVGVETIRFYEREGLLPQPERRPSGYRLYPDEAVDHVRFIRQAKELGFLLKEIRELLDLRVDGKRTCSDVRSMAEAKIADITKKMDMLQRMRTTLDELVEACDRNVETDACPILQAIAREDHT